ncbi:fibronectin type III domain-containing protein [Apilactobacillus timberlakei]|uniref:fibronectin type III domain-containing protein n=1 Tax=Apilactobacillus timberlakei TaxID=2008380 RepID=UPI00112CE4CD|nr:fibronectin type III domain-containing protein [Apilactobacillus timberlakei]TPR21457.1 fibronectin type III domain-containing protein [Apilactobacillus timberlakei]
MVLVFKDTVLTNKGFDVSNRAALGQTQFSIFKAVSTDFDLTNYKIEDLKNLTSLPNEIDSGTILDYDSPQNSISVINLDFNNSQFKQGYTIRAIGLYGKSADGDVFLHSLTVSDTPVVVPEISGNVFDGVKHSISIFSGNNKNMNVNIQQTSNATVKYVNDSISKLNDDLIKYINDNYNTLNKKIENDIRPALNQKVNNNDFETFKKDTNENIKNIDLSKVTEDANKYTDETKKDLKEIINGKQPAGKYLTTDEFNKYDLSVDDGKLMYGDKPVLIANAPNAPKLSVQINTDTGNLDYQITPPRVDGGASINNYKLSYKKDVDSDWETINLDTENLLGSLSSLDKGANYNLKVVAENYAGSGIESEITNIMTATVPSKVLIDVVDNYPNGINYNINVENDGGLPVLYYQIFYKTASDSYWKFLDHPSKNGTISQIDTLDNNYQIKAKAGNQMGLSDDSNVINTTIQTTTYGYGTPTAYVGSHMYFYQPGVFISSSVPSFDFNVDIRKSICTISLDGYSYFYGTSNQYIDPQNLNYASPNNPTISLNLSQFSENQIIDLAPYFNFRNNRGLYMAFTERSIKLYNCSQNNTDLNSCPPNNPGDGGIDIEILKGITIKYSQVEKGTQ